MNQNRTPTSALWLLALLLHWSVSASGAEAVRLASIPQEPALAAVAVTDFESPDATADTAAFGLADVLAVELQQRGVALFERQQIRVLLGERRITASGLMQLRKMPAQEIPDLQYLITGALRPQTNQQLHLEVALVEAHSGRSVASFARESRDAGELPSALASLADQIARHLKSSKPTLAAKPPPPLRTDQTPEVNLLFYKGISYCLAGQPEMGVTWFIDAQRVAPNFLAARVWTLRAFEMLGLSEFAAVARAKVLASAGGPTILNRLDRSPFWNQKTISVAVLADPGLGADGWRFQTALKMALARNTNFFVADHANIRMLAREMDLQLAENGGRELELASVLWSAVDALVIVSEDAADGGLVSVELREALSGECWFRARARRDSVGLENLSRELAGQIVNRRPTGAGEALFPSPGRVRAPKPRQVSNVDRDEFAALLRYVAENARDREALVRLALFVRWLNTGSNEPHAGLYQCAIADRIVTVTKPDAPDAAHWLSAALWHRRYYEGIYGKLPPFAVEAAPLLERYPDSPEAYYARSALALELINEKKFAEAAPILLNLAEVLPKLAKRVEIRPEYWANYYFFTAAALRETGEPARARQFLDQADVVLRQNPDLVMFPYALGVWVNHFPASHPLFGPERNLRQAVTAWQQQLAATGANAGQSAVTLEDLERMLAEARQAGGAEAERKFLDYLRHFAEHQQSHPKLYRGPITEEDPREPWRQIRLWNATTAGNYTLLGKLIVETPGVLKQLALAGDSAAKLQAVRRLAHELADSLDDAIAANFLEAVGEYELALEKVEAAQRKALTSPESLAANVYRRDYVAGQLRKQRIRLLQTLRRPLDAAAYARAQIPAGTNRPPADVCMDAGEAWLAAGRADEASRLFAGLVRASGDDGNMDAYGATLRLCWADYEFASGNIFEASEILRAVTRQSEGKDWGVYLRTGYVQAYDAAVSRLAKLRGQTRFAMGSDDWGKVRRQSSATPDIAEVEPTALEKDLRVLLRGDDQGGGQRRYSSSQGAAFARKHGRAAVPAILRAAVRDDESAMFIAWTCVLDQAATAEDAPAVLEAFKQSPRLAQTAFRLDRSNATVILRERFGVYAKGGNVPPELRRAIGQYALLDQYPVLMANLAVKDLDGNTAVIATELDAMLQTNSTPALFEAFHSALGTAIGRQMLSHYRHGLAKLGEIALRHGWPEGFEAVLHGGDPSAPDALSRVRKYVDLPDGEAEARAVLESGLGRWQWNADTGKFMTSASEATIKRTRGP